MSEPDFSDIKMRLTADHRRRLDVMASARGQTPAEFVTAMIDQADRVLFHGKASELVAGQMKDTAATAGQ